MAVRLSTEFSSAWWRRGFDCTLGLTTFPDVVPATEEATIMFETHLTIVGTLITPVNRRRLTDGTSVVSFRVASNERRFDRATASWTDGDSLYVQVSCWRQLAENVHRSFNVGDPIIVRGRLHSRSYDDRDGKRQTVIELEGLAVGPDLTRATVEITRLRRDGSAPAPGPRSTDSDPDSDGVADLTGDAVSDLGTDDPWLVADGIPGHPEDGSRDGVDRRGAAIEAGVGA
jgi:single-strand DNA-binding protein